MLGHYLLKQSQLFTGREVPEIQEDLLFIFSQQLKLEFYLKNSTVQLK